MKKIAIYGDSFGAEHAPYGWSYLLQQEDPDNIDIYAQPSSSLDWSFNNFLTQHSNYEQNIFVVTTQGRVHLPVRCQHKKTKEIKIIEHWGGLDQIEEAMLEYTSDYDMLQKLWDCAVYVASKQYIYLFNTHKAIVNYIKHIRPDTIIIPAFRTGDPSIDADINGDYNWSLIDICTRETAKFGELGKIKNDTRCNHFSKPSNQWVLSHVKARLEGKMIEWTGTETPAFQNYEELRLYS